MKVEFIETSWANQGGIVRMLSSKIGLTLLIGFTGIQVLAAQQPSPVLRYDFEEKTIPGTTSQNPLKLNQPGPRPAEFPDFPAENHALQVDASEFIAVPDLGDNSPYDFANGDTLTIEAWINPSSTTNASPRYIIGKGRTGSTRFPPDNQNWSLRLVDAQGATHLSFLFATARGVGDQHWHRWTSTVGFPPASGWHHVALTYTFGQPQTIRGWIDGVSVDGVWDLGGPTTEPPVVDDDEIRIGNSYAGLIDRVAIHRTLWSDSDAKAQFNRVGGPRIAKPVEPVMPQLGEVPAGKVLIQISEGFPSRDRWLYEGETPPEESLRWHSDAFLLHELPLHYDSWGIRSPWKAPILLRLAADVEMPQGDYQFLIRLRSLGRLWVDGQLIAETAASTYRPPDGEERVTPVPAPPAPGQRLPDYHSQEGKGSVTIAPAVSFESANKDRLQDDGQNTKRVRVVFELVVGGVNHRTETGEILVAYRPTDVDAFTLLEPCEPESRSPLIDDLIEPRLQQMELVLRQLNDQRRREANASRASFWKARHDIARQWIETNATTTVDQTNIAGQHPIDRWIREKVERVRWAPEAENAEDSKFRETVEPILKAKCTRCHGPKRQGDLRLDSREALLKGGESEGPAIVVFHPEDSPLIQRVQSTDHELRMPPDGDPLSQAEIESLEQWIQKGAHWPRRTITDDQIPVSRSISEHSFVRRAYLDTVGVVPTTEELNEWLGTKEPLDRELLIETLLNDERVADHWVTFWMDILAENPSLLNASLNSSGPFRWFLHDSLRDHKPIDQMLTELILMRGGAAEGGSAGFSLSGENDAPYAAKAHILASALLGIELQCARCHDSPFHRTTQKDLYSLAAMLEKKTVKVPVTSRVPAAFFEEQKSRQPLIQASLPPDQAVAPAWPFASATGVEDSPKIDRLVENANDSRERLAALITSPENRRFPRVMVNHLWNRLMGAGLVEPVQDWEDQVPSHPELLDDLAFAFVESGYDFRYVIRLIMTSHAYQSEAMGQNHGVDPELRFFTAPDRRRMSAEQLVDSLHVAAGQSFDVEELTFVHDGRRPLGSRQTLGTPTRAWMFGDLKNERDRPSLSLPKARAIADVLEAFGWTGSRQMPIHEREVQPNVLQPGVLANGTLVQRLSRATIQSELSELALEAKSPEALVDELFLRFLGRLPQPDEAASFVEELTPAFATRIIPEEEVVWPKSPELLPRVTWFNHGRPQANTIQLEMEKRAAQGPPPHPRLRNPWREAYEDVVWSLMNTSEFIWIP
jgi:hypothetical protein